MVVAARNRIGRTRNQPPQAACWDSLRHSDLNCSNRPVRTRMPGGVGWDRSGTLTDPYPDWAGGGYCCRGIGRGAGRGCGADDSGTGTYCAPIPPGPGAITTPPGDAGL